MGVRARFLSLLICTCAAALGCSSAPTGVILPDATPEKKKEYSLAEKARLMVEVANTSYRDGDLTGALQQLARAEELDSSLPEIHHTRALIYHAKRDYPKAIASARQAVKLMPRFSAAHNTLGKLLMDMGHLKDAESPLLAAAQDELNREAYKAHMNLGILYYRLGDDRRAEAHFNQAIEDAPAVSCIAHYYKGHIELKKGRFQDAIAQYDRATQRLCASFADAHLALGIAYERSKLYDRAKKKFIDIKNNFPNTKVAEQAMDRLKFLP